MKKIGIMLVVLVVITGLVYIDVALAGGVGKRQVRQQERILQGIETGELTRAEAGCLKREQRHIQRQKRTAWSDGELTRQERLRLERKQDRASRHIYRAKHNNITR